MSDLILASGSKARQTMLRNAGLEFEIAPADIDEANALKTVENKGFSAAQKAEYLAAQKALSIAQKNPNALVIGSDQILELDGEIFSKAKNNNEAHEKLMRLRGKTHALHSGVAVAQNDEVLWQICETAKLSMHDFSAEFLDRYLNEAGDAPIVCVGGYALEDIGIQLFEKIEGDYFTILGMPLLPLLTYLREQQGTGL